MISKFIKIYKFKILLSFLILFFYLFLRVYNLTLLPVFGDEAIYIHWSQVMKEEPTLRFLPLSDGKQPLFMWITIFFLKIFNDPLYAARFVSVLSGLGSLIGIFCLTLLLFNSFGAGLVAAIIYTLSPFTVFFDRMALVDCLLTMFFIWTLFFVVLTVKKVRLDTAMLAGFCFGGALLTKSPGIFLSILIPFSLFLAKWPKGFVNKFNKLSVFVFLFTFTFLIGFAMYNILRLGPNFHMIGIRNKDYVFPISHIWENPKDPFIFHIREIFDWLWILGPLELLILFVFAVLTNFNKYKSELVSLLGFLLIPLFVNAMYAKVFTARYILYTLPFLFIISSSNFVSNKGAYVKISLLFVFILHSLYFNYFLLTKVDKAPLPKNERSGYLLEWTAGYGIKEVADYLKGYHLKNPDEKIVVGTEGYFGTLPDGLQMYLKDFPEILVIGVGLDLKEIPQSLKESKNSGNKTFLVINNSRLKANPQDLNLRQILSFPKPPRSPESERYKILGPQEVLFLFEVE